MALSFSGVVCRLVWWNFGKNVAAIRTVYHRASPSSFSSLASSVLSTHPVLGLGLGPDLRLGPVPDRLGALFAIGPGF